jgi:hypothetical protein
MWNACAARFPHGDVTFAQLSCPLNAFICCLHCEQLTYPSINFGRHYSVMSHGQHQHNFAKLGSVMKEN